MCGYVAARLWNLFFLIGAKYLKYSGNSWNNWFHQLTLTCGFVKKLCKVGKPRKKIPGSDIGRLWAVFSIAADVWCYRSWCYRSTILQSLVTYFIGRKSVSLLWFWQKSARNTPFSPTFSGESHQPPLLQCRRAITVLVWLPLPALHYPSSAHPYLPPAMPQQ